MARRRTVSHKGTKAQRRKERGGRIVAAPRVKICGVREALHARAAWNAHADAVGLNFYEGSRRYIGGVEAAQELMKAAPSGWCAWAGVFVDMELDALAKVQEALKLGIIQLHGAESADYVCKVKARFPDAQVWKAFRISTREDLKAIESYVCDAWLLDAKAPGSGETFDWGLLEHLPRSTPLVLSGGLNAENVAEAIRRVGPEWVDVASGVESAPGEKSTDLIRGFVQAAKK